MGKSTIFINMIAQDMERGRSVFLLDPHGQAIRDLFERYPHIQFALKKECIYLLDPTDEAYCFGINPLYCPDVTSLAKRQQTYDKALTFSSVFGKKRTNGVYG